LNDFGQICGVKAYLMLLVIPITTSCGNYNLADQLENPGANGASANKRLYAFVSAVLARGDMRDGANNALHPNCGAATSYAAADCYCLNTALDNGLMAGGTKTYVAWLSGSLNDMTCRIQGINGQQNCTPSGDAMWYDVSNNLIADSYVRLFSIGVDLINPVNRTATGSTVTAGAFTWSGTQGNGLTAGAPAANNCSDWTLNTSQTGVTGRTGGTGSTWSALDSQNCSVSGHIFCFGVR